MYVPCVYLISFGVDCIAFSNLGGGGSLQCCVVCAVVYNHCWHASRDDNLPTPEYLEPRTNEVEGYCAKRRPTNSFYMIDVSMGQAGMVVPAFFCSRYSDVVVVVVVVQSIYLVPSS